MKCMDIECQKTLTEDNAVLCRECYIALCDSYSKFRWQREEAMKTLQQYGRHRPECCSHRWSVTSDRVAHECDCGLAAGMARVKGEQK